MSDNSSSIFGYKTKLCIEGNKKSKRSIYAVPLLRRSIIELKYHVLCN